MEGRWWPGCLSPPREEVEKSNGDSCYLLSTYYMQAGPSQTLRCVLGMFSFMTNSGYGAGN